MVRAVTVLALRAIEDPRFVKGIVKGRDRVGYSGVSLNDNVLKLKRKKNQMSGLNSMWQSGTGDCFSRHQSQASFTPRRDRTNYVV